MLLKTECSTHCGSAVLPASLVRTWLETGGPLPSKTAAAARVAAANIEKLPDPVYLTVYCWSLTSMSGAVG